MIDQQTKTQLQDRFQEIKPKLKQQFPQVGEQELTKAQSDPDAFVQTLAWGVDEDENVYIACRCWDEHPERISAAVKVNRLVRW